MTRIVRARHESGALKPFEKLDLDEGEEVEIIVCRKSSHAFRALLRRRPDLNQRMSTRLLRRSRAKVFFNLNVFLKHLADVEEARKLLDRVECSEWGSCVASKPMNKT